MKAYVYFATIGAALAGCAYGDTGVDPFQKHDAGIVHADGGKDAKAPVQDAGPVEDAWQQPDVQQQTTCSSLPLPTGMPQCDSCLSASCCAEDQTCGNDQECIAFIGCVNNCFNTVDGGLDQQCETTCETDYPNGVSELGNLDMCMQNSCATDCGI